MEVVIDTFEAVPEKVTSVFQMTYVPQEEVIVDCPEMDEGMFRAWFDVYPYWILTEEGIGVIIINWT